MRFRLLAALVILLPLLALTGCATSDSKTVATRAPVTTSGRAEYGMASWHGPSPKSRESRTASGRKWTNGDLIAAHKTLPMGTYVRVTHLKTKRVVVVQIIDRGPYIRGRIVDLSPRAAEALGITGSGVGQVKLEVVKL
jgi:rare lipoprotein A